MWIQYRLHLKKKIELLLYDVIDLKSMCKNIYSASEVLDIRRLDTLKQLVYSSREDSEMKSESKLAWNHFVKNSDPKFYCLYKDNLESELLSISNDISKCFSYLQQRKQKQSSVPESQPPGTTNNSGGENNFIVPSLMRLQLSNQNLLKLLGSPPLPNHPLFIDLHLLL